MRFWTQRCSPTSGRIEIIDSRGAVKTFNVDERDAEFVCGALNAADKSQLTSAKCREADHLQ